MSQYILAIDQGTTSAKTALIDKNLCISHKVSKSQENIYSRPGYAETDPILLYENVKALCNESIDYFNSNLKKSDKDSIVGIGITNQRETCLIWDKLTGQPLTNAILWNDSRTADIVESLINFNKCRDAYAKITGLPISTYFSAFKFKWMMENGSPELLLKLEKNEVCFGTIDTWIIYKLTDGKTFATDTTNASRTMLMNINSCEWDSKMLHTFSINKSWLPSILSSSDDFGISENLKESIPIIGVIGDQQAACLGHGLAENEVKCTYGTGGFLLMSTGSKLIFSNNGLLSTILYRSKDGVITYALEGAIETAGNALTWLNKSMNIFKDFDELQVLHDSVNDNGGVIFVPSFSGLFSPYWDTSFKGSILGLTTNTEKGHLIRATIEAICLRTFELISCFEEDTNVKIHNVRVDGGMASNNSFLQTNAGIINCNVITKEEVEITIIGAAAAAFMKLGIISSIEEVHQMSENIKVQTPNLDKSARSNLIALWKKAIEKTRNWN